MFEHVLLVLCITLIAGFFVHNKMLWRWDNLLYDEQLSFWSRSVSDDIIIVAIDDESLNELGHWPWSRSTHARLINKLELESPQAIGLDIIISEPNLVDPQSDLQLATAIKASGKVVLPVYMSQKSSNSYPIEALPLPILTQQAAALGHVHLDISDDGIARKVYLKEGIGKPHWEHYSLAILSVMGIDNSEYTNNKVDLQKQYSSMLWSKEAPFLIPYAGPPGHFQRIGYSQVLSGHYPKNLFRDKIVLIGATAEGMSDIIPTPLSGKSGSMAGVEVIANIIDALLNDYRITELSGNSLVLITTILVALPLLIYPHLNPGSTLLVLFGIVIATISIAAILLWQFGLWIHLSTALLFQFISYPLWSWRRLKLVTNHINAELDILTSQQKALSVHREKNIQDEITFISLFIPINGWQLQDEHDQMLFQQGTVLPQSLMHLKEQNWTVDKNNYWAYLNYQNKHCKLGLSLAADAPMSVYEMDLLDSLLNDSTATYSDQTVYTEDVLQ